MDGSADWQGITQAASLTDEEVTTRNALACAAESFDWQRVIEIAAEREDLVNACRLDAPDFLAPLHHAAMGNAPSKVVDRLVELGAWRSLRSATGERPLDIAVRLGHRSLEEALRPRLKHTVPAEALRDVQRNFHGAIVDYVPDLVAEHQLRLPELEPLLELEDTEGWFAVPGMYGGFRYWFDAWGDEPRLIAESWIRVVSGSETRHEITRGGFRSYSIAEE